MLLGRGELLAVALLLYLTFQPVSLATPEQYDEEYGASDGEEQERNLNKQQEQEEEEEDQGRDQEQDQDEEEQEMEQIANQKPEEELAIAEYSEDFPMTGSTSNSSEPGQGEGGHSGGGNDASYDYDYSSPDRDEDNTEYYDYKEETRTEDAELKFLPELTSRPLSLQARPGQEVVLPCEAKDAERFVRVWEKEGEMLFTGNIRLTDDSRFSLSDNNSSLVLKNSGPEDSGNYECRIMVKQVLSVKHSLRVTDTFTVKVDPNEGVLVVPQGRNATFSCKVSGDGLRESLTWTRDSSRFRDGSYSQAVETIILEDVRLEDAGYYYCTVTGPEDDTKAASLQLQVLSAPVVLAMEKRLEASGTGPLAELTCTIAAHPRPKVTWYKDGALVTTGGRVESGEAGLRHVLTIRQYQESDGGSYMCYATNQLGSTQHSSLLGTDDRQHISQPVPDDRQPEPAHLALALTLRQLQAELKQDRAELTEFKQLMARELAELRRPGSAGNQSEAQPQNSLERALLSDIERLEVEVAGLRASQQRTQADLYTVKRNSEEDRQRLWDNVNELQEVTNITTRNIEDIYDKDILRLQNFQNLVAGDINKIKLDLTGALESGGLSGSKEARMEAGDLVELKLSQEQVMAEVKMLRNMQTNTRNSHQTFRNELHTVFGDIDELKKEKQSSAMQLEQLKRLINRLEVERIDENKASILDIRKVMQTLESSMGKTMQKVKKVARQQVEPMDQDKLQILLNEVQKLKNQIFFLQQTLIHIRSQDQVTVGVQAAELGPAYRLEASSEIASVRAEIEQLTALVNSRTDERDCLAREEFNSRSTHLEKLLSEQSLLVAEQEMKVAELKELRENTVAQLDRIQQSLAQVKKEIEAEDRERRRYYLLIQGMRRRSKLERPAQLMAMVATFLRVALKLKDVSVEEAVRIEDVLGRRPEAVRVKFSSLRDRNLVLAASKNTKTRLKVVEDFTERVKRDRQVLANYAREQARQTRSKWALQDEKLYFNRKIYVFNETTNEVTAIADID